MLERWASQFSMVACWLRRLGGVAEIVQAGIVCDRLARVRIGFGLLVRAGLPDASLEVRKRPCIWWAGSDVGWRKTAACYWFRESWIWHRRWGFKLCCNSGRVATQRTASFISLFYHFVADQARSPQRRLFECHRLNLEIEHGGGPIDWRRLGRKAPPPVSCFESMKRRRDAWVS